MKKKKSNLIVAAIVFVLLAGALGTGTYKFLKDTITEIVSSYIDELADHDIRSIREFVSGRWDNMKRIHNALQIKEIKTVEEMQSELNIKVVAADFDRIYLIDEEGKLYSNSHSITPKEKNEFLEYFDPGKKQFVMRYNDVNRYHEYKKEYMLYGLDFEDSPIEVENVKFVKMVMLNDISKIRTRMRISSFDDRGYNSVIDSDGAYIVNYEDNSGLDEDINFFDAMERSRIEGYTAKEVVEKIKNREHIEFWFTSEYGERKFVSVNYVEDFEWSFINVVEESVFSDESSKFVRILTLLIIGMVLIAAITLFVFSLTQRKLKHFYSSVVDGVYNRQYYNDKLAESRVRALAIIDMDHLKEINDVYGHLAGDEAIREMALILLQEVGDFADIFRFGGDEFVAVFKDEIIADRFQRLLRNSLDEIREIRLEEFPEVRITFSIGGYYGEGIAKELLKNADMLLYKAKKTRNCVVTNT